MGNKVVRRKKGKKEVGWSERERVGAEGNNICNREIMGGEQSSLADVILIYTRRLILSLAVGL